MRALCSLPEPSPLVKGGSELQRLEPPAVMTRRERILVCNTRSMTLVCFGVFLTLVLPRETEVS